MWDERSPKMAWKATAQGDIPEERSQTDFARRDTEDFEEKGGIAWKGVGVMARDCDRRKAFCKPSTPTGRRDSTKRSGV